MNFYHVCNEILENATKTVTKALDKDGNLKDFEVSKVEE
jgi:exonuclease VII small subunit